MNIFKIHIEYSKTKKQETHLVNAEDAIDAWALIRKSLRYHQTRNRFSIIYIIKQ